MRGTSDVLRLQVLLLALVAVLTLPENQRLLLVGLMRELLRGMADMGMLSAF
jgi:hypothetical protein